MQSKQLHMNSNRTDRCMQSQHACMQDTKSLDGKITLLSYLARQLSIGPAPAALLAEEVPHVVGPALKVSVQVTHSISLHHCSSIDSGHA